MKNENKNHMKRDLSLITVILLIAGAGLLFNHMQSADNNIIINSNENQQQSNMTSYVEISIDGKIIEKLDLNQNIEMTIHGYNNGTNHLIIENGQVWIDDASCPDKVCIHQGKINRNAEIIVCLPNLMIAQVRIAENTESPESAAE